MDSSLTISSSEQLNNLNSEIQYNEVKITSLPESLSIEQLNKFSSNLNQGAKLEISVKDLNDTQISNIVSNLKLTGFVSVSYNSDQKIVTCTKKVWKKNNLNNNEAKLNENESNKNTNNPWKVLKVEEKADLVYEDELIDPFDNYKKFSKESDCITKPKPCKNCNCGRAEKKEVETKSEFKPSCNKCYMGDAFRCAGCPYRGMPAFNPGDKITFGNTTDLTSDTAENGVTIKGDKVKIDL